MCPHCGMTYDPAEVPWHLRSVSRLVPEHFTSAAAGAERCPGSWQNPRNPESDRRSLWKDAPAEGGES
jgi:hypothetical protein